MRLDKLTIKAQEALEAAAGIASEGDAAAVEPEHLLKALLDQADGIVRPILSKIGADPAALDAADRRGACVVAPCERGGPAGRRPTAQHGALGCFQVRREDEGRLRLERAPP